MIDGRTGYRKFKFSKERFLFKKKEYLQFGQTSLCRRRPRPLGLPRRHDLFKIIIELFMLIPIMSFLLIIRSSPLGQTPEDEEQIAYVFD